MAQRGSRVPAGQFVPGVPDVVTVPSRPSPVTVAFAVTEKVIVAVAPTARSPVQVRFGLVNDTVPVEAVASPW